VTVAVRVVAIDNSRTVRSTTAALRLRFASCRSGRMLDDLGTLETEGAWPDWKTCSPARRW
jgi:hypothetical protein